MGKRYYWLKLKNDFFQSKEIKKLRTIAGGDTYTIIYLKMMLYSLDKDGLIEYEEFEDTLAEEIALAIDERPDNVGVTLQYLLKKGLAQIVDGRDLMMTIVPELTWSEGSSAQRMRELRSRKALQSDTLALQSDSTVTTPLQIGDVEIEKEKEIEKELEKSKKAAKPQRHKYGMYDNVLLSDEEMEKLKTEFPDWESRIDKLSEYMRSTGKSYKDHLATIRAWARKDKDKPQAPARSAYSNSFHNFKQREYDYDALMERIREKNAL